MTKLWTKRGLTVLGKTIRAARIAKGWSLDTASEATQLATNGRAKISKKTIGNVENGIGEPKYNTLAAIAAAGFVVNSAGHPLTEADFIDIACELIDPENL